MTNASWVWVLFSYTRAVETLRRDCGEEAVPPMDSIGTADVQTL